MYHVCYQLNKTMHMNNFSKARPKIPVPRIMKLSPDSHHIMKRSWKGFISAEVLLMF